MKKLVPKGIIVPVVTPFDQKGNIDEAALRRIIRYTIAGGVHGIFVAGTTSEFYALTQEEHAEIFRIAVDEVRGQLPVYGGATGITTAQAIRLARLAEEAGVDGVSILTPYFISLSQEEIYQHYKAIAESTNLPILLYDNKPKTHLTISPETVQRLAEISNIIGIKDSTGDLTNTIDMIRRTKDIPDFYVLMGRDSLVYSALCSGASGAVCACANVAPRLTADIYDKFMSGDLEGAQRAQFSLVPLRIAFSLGSFPAVIKDALRLIGIDAGECRRPTPSLNQEELLQLRGILTEMGLIL